MAGGIRPERNRHNCCKINSMNTDRRNWAGNYSYGAASFAIPENVEQVREAVGSAAKRGRWGRGTASIRSRTQPACKFRWKNSTESSASIRTR